MEAVVEVEGLEKVYGGGFFAKPTAALAGISFKIQKGELMGLLGPNGAGKTTTVKVLVGLVTPTKGSARLFGRSAFETDARRKLGYLPERAAPPEYLTGYECLDREGRLHDMAREERKKASARLLERVRLPDAVAKRRVGTFSKGERGRLGLACALVADPDAILLDEPTDGLDPVGRREVRELLVELKKEGKAILLNSHLLSEAELCCDHVAILSRGELKASGKTDELLASGTRVLAVRTVPKASDEDLAQIAKVSKAARREGEGLIIELAQESDVDKLVDLVRSRGLSLRELVARRASLEEFFLEKIGDAASSPPGGST
ncbi:ABC transporter ATP-binding protein [bacterium]|nr:ABC transporter ATP-binding protein [bacterium]